METGFSTRTHALTHAHAGSSDRYLSAGLLHKALVGDLEGSAERRDRVLVEAFLLHQVDVEVVGGVVGSVHAAVAVEHPEVGLFLLILRDGSRSVSTGCKYRHIQH